MVARDLPREAASSPGLYERVSQAIRVRRLAERSVVSPVDPGDRGLHPYVSRVLPWVRTRMDEADATLWRVEFDCVVFDRMLPDGDAIDFPAPGSNRSEANNRIIPPIMSVSPASCTAPKYRIIGCVITDPAV